MPASTDRERRGVKKSRLTEPISHSGPSLLQSKPFCHSHDERGQLALCQVRLLFVNWIGKQFFFVHWTLKFLAMTNGKYSRWPQLCVDELLSAIDIEGR